MDSDIDNGSKRHSDKYVHLIQKPVCNPYGNAVTPWCFQRTTICSPLINRWNIPGIGEHRSNFHQPGGYCLRSSIFNKTQNKRKISEISRRDDTKTKKRGVLNQINNCMRRVNKSLSWLIDMESARLQWNWMNQSPFHCCYMMFNMLHFSFFDIGLWSSYNIQTPSHHSPQPFYLQNAS